MNRNYDVVVILNGGVDENGNLNNDTKTRLIKGLEASREFDIPNILVCGRDAKKMKVFLETQKGAEKKEIFLEDVSRNTIENAHFTKTKYLQTSNFQSIVLVTDKFHSKRARLTFELVLGGAFKIKSIDSDAGYSTLQKDELKKQEKFFLELTRSSLAGVSADEDSKRQKILEQNRKTSTDYFPPIRK